MSAKPFRITPPSQSSDAKVCASMPDGIDAAGKNSFALIGVVMAGVLAKLSSALKSLKRANPQAKIILLAQMYQEPIARKLVMQILQTII